MLSGLLHAIHILLESLLIDLEGMLLFEDDFTKHKNQLFSISIFIDKNETLSDGSHARDELPPVVKKQRNSLRYRCLNMLLFNFQN